MRANKDVQNLTQAEIENELLLENLEKNKWHRYKVAIRKDWPLYAMLVPVLLYFFIFRYMPIYGILAAFKNQNDLTLGVGQSPYSGFYAFRSLIAGDYSKEFWQAFRNTFAISMYGLIFGFPVPIILALFFSEIKNDFYRSVTQILTYLPKFISTVVITSIITLMLFEGNEPHQAPGVLTSFFTFLHLIPEGTRMLAQPEYLYTVRHITKNYFVFEFGNAYSYFMIVVSIIVVIHLFYKLKVQKERTKLIEEKVKSYAN